MSANFDLNLLEIIGERLEDDRKHFLKALNLTDESDQNDEKDQKEIEKKLAALKNWKEKQEGEEWLEKLEEQLKDLSDFSVNEQDLKDKSSDEIFNLICQRLDKENWIKFASDLQLTEEKEINEKGCNEQVDSATFYCLLKDKWLNGEETLSTEQTDKLRDVLKEIGREDILEGEEFQNLNLVPTDQCTDTIEDDTAENCVTTVQKVVQVVTEHSEVHTATSHTSEGNEEEGSDEKEEKLVSSVTVEKRTEFREKTQTVETKQEVIVSTQKTIQVIEEETAKEVEASPPCDKEENKEVNGVADGENKNIPDDEKEKDDSAANEKKDKSKDSSEEDDENKEHNENGDQNDNKDKVEICDGKDDGKKKKKRSIPKFFSCFSKKGAE